MAHINLNDFINLAGMGSDSITKWVKYNWLNNTETFNQVTKTFNNDSAVYAVKNAADFSVSGGNIPFDITKQWNANLSEVGFDDSTKSLILQGETYRCWMYLNGDKSKTGKYRVTTIFKVNVDDDIPAYTNSILNIYSSSDTIKTSVFSNGTMKVSIKTRNNTVPFEFDKFHTLTYILDFDTKLMDVFLDGELVLSAEGPSSPKIDGALSIFMPTTSSGVLPYIKTYIKLMSIDKYIPESE